MQQNCVLRHKPKKKNKPNTHTNNPFIIINASCALMLCYLIINGHIALNAFNQLKCVWFLFIFWAFSFISSNVSRIRQFMFSCLPHVSSIVNIFNEMAIIFYELQCVILINRIESLNGYLLQKLWQQGCPSTSIMSKS